jgi:hypothetical protein
MKNHPLHCKVTHASIFYPHQFKFCTEHSLSAPRSMVVDGIISYGGSTGSGYKLARKAYGEFFERNHLFTGVKINGKFALSSIVPQIFRDKLISLCRSSATSANDHLFSFTEVHNLFDDSLQHYFYNTISLRGAAEDSEFINFSDSCACAVHPEKDKAVYNSLMEFIERQALVGSWLSKRCCYRINPEVLLHLTPYTDLAANLLENGQLVIFSNGNLLPGHSTLMFYFANSPKDMVQYSIGSSCGLTLEESLTSSLEELYQCYSFLYNTECSVGLENKAGSGYHLSFQQCNHAGVKDVIPFIHQNNSTLINTADDVINAKQYTYEEILIGLKELSNDIYYYHHFEPSLDLHFIKILSPDFFAHMSLNDTLNVTNAYAHKLGITKESGYWVKIPFP